MKHLLLLRHAKSDWDAPFKDDHARPLAARGIKAAKTMGRLLATAGQLPDLVLSSSAVRARNTVELAAASGGWPCEIVIKPELYATHAEAVVSLVRELPDDRQMVLLAGHEPTTSELAEKLIGGGRLRVPTAAMLRIDFPVNHWSEAAVGGGELIWLLQPKFFKKIG